MRMFWTIGWAIILAVLAILDWLYSTPTQISGFWTCVVVLFAVGYVCDELQKDT